jgi:hypothetical protein
MDPRLHLTDLFGEATAKKLNQLRREIREVSVFDVTLSDNLDFTLDKLLQFIEDDVLAAIRKAEQGNTPTPPPPPPDLPPATVRGYA